MLTFHALYVDQYKKLIEEEILRLLEVVLSNNAIQDFSSYKYRLGVIDGLKKALELAEEADAIANGRDQEGE
jgi:hypothetical protein